MFFLAQQYAGYKRCVYRPLDRELDRRSSVPVRHPAPHQARSSLESKVNTIEKYISSPLIMLGNSLTIIGCLGLLFGLSGAIDAELFAVGISSGMRVIGAVAVTGCLLSAIGYGIADYLTK